MNCINILLVGVGGQGVVLASDLLARLGMNNTYDVKKSDSLGMAQRGGGVVSHVRWSDHVFSPIIKQGDVDFLLATEQLEAARWASHVKKEGVAIVADVTVAPAYVADCRLHYPTWEEVDKILRQYTNNIHLVRATHLTREIGNPKVLNMVMLGFLSAFLDIKDGQWLETIRNNLPEEFVASCIAAFLRGRSEAETRQ